MGKLTAKAAISLVNRGTKGSFSDGNNLYLRVTAPGSAKWTFRYMIAGRAREMGLGAFDPNGQVGASLAEAREAAIEARRVLRKGSDPIEEKRRVAAELKAQAGRGASFESVAAQLISSLESGWRNKKHRDQWEATLKAYVYPKIGRRLISEIATDDILQILQPIWTAKPETASRVRGRIESVISYAGARGWRTGENPARWRGHLDRLLPSKAKVAKVKNYAALPWSSVGNFVSSLREQQSMAALAMEFLIYTATRTNEVLGAKWDEVNFEEKVWIIPSTRMKAAREHRVPLSNQALDILRELFDKRQDEHAGYIFPGQRRGRPLSQMAMLMVLRRMDRADITVHGFRSSFRDWVEECTSTPHAVAEAALAHAISDKVEAAYRRSDLLQKRAALMQQWADHCRPVN